MSVGGPRWLPTSARAHGSATFRPGEQFVEHGERLALVLFIGPGHVPGPHRAVQGHQPGDAVAAEVARPQIATIMSMPRVRCPAVRPWSACSRWRRPCHADTLSPITCPLRNRNRPVMPEGHTLHRLARGLNDAFAGQIVAASSPQGRFAESAALIDQTVLVEASAHGKHLFSEFGHERWLHVHLGLIGSFVLSAPTPPRGEVRLRLATVQTVADLRGPQLCAIKTRAEIEAQIAALGPDPLRSDADPDAGLAADPAGNPPDCRAVDGSDDPVGNRKRLSS